MQGNGPVRQSKPEEKSVSAARTPRRVVLLKDGDNSDVERVLSEYGVREASTADVSAEVHRFASEHPGRTVAAEWQGPRAWVRFLWCRNPPQRDHSAKLTDRG